MLSPKFVVLFVGIFIKVGDSWNVFPSLSKSSLESFAKEKISNLKNLRQSLEKSQNDTHVKNTTHKSGTNIPPQPEFPIILSQNGTQNYTNMTLEEVQKLDKISLATVAKKLSTMTDKSRDNLLYQMLPDKPEFLNKIKEVRDMIAGIKDDLQPKVKGFLTDKYNMFLNNLVPYSETIGISIDGLNSLKISKNFDTRVHKNRKESNHIQGRSDDQDFLSDQEPSPSSKGQKYQHIFLSPRSRPQASYIVPENYRNEISFDRVGNSFGQDSDLHYKGYYPEDSSVAASADQEAAAGSHGRGHGHGGGHGGGGGENGMTNPFSILGSLAFLTFLAALFQRALTTTMAMGRGRRISNGWDSDSGEDFEITEASNKLQLNDTLMSRLQNQTNFGPTPVKVIPVAPQCSKLCQLLRTVMAIPKLLKKSN